jgi:hypothetical protein
VECHGGKTRESTRTATGQADNSCGVVNQRGLARGGSHVPRTPKAMNLLLEYTKSV